MLDGKAHAKTLLPTRPQPGKGKARQRGRKQESMVVRIRLARFGCRNRPFYRVMATDSRSPRDGKHLEVLGYYNPLLGKDGGKRMGLKFKPSVSKTKNSINSNSTVSKKKKSRN